MKSLKMGLNVDVEIWRLGIDPKVNEIWLQTCSLQHNIECWNIEYWKEYNNQNVQPWGND